MTATIWLRRRLGLHGRANPWKVLALRGRRRLARPLCVLRRHRHWERETMLTAFATSRSARCRTCGRLVLKPEYR